MAEPRKQLARLSNPEISGDGKALCLTVETEDGDSYDLAIKLTEIGHVVQFLISASNFAAGLDEDRPKGAPAVPLAPIPIKGMAFSPGMSPTETHLVVGFEGFHLALEIPSSQLAKIASDFARIAVTLSAPVLKPN
jgi:hypothetical protein